MSVSIEVKKVSLRASGGMDMTTVKANDSRKFPLSPAPGERSQMLALEGQPAAGGMLRPDIWQEWKSLLGPNPESLVTGK